MKICTVQRGLQRKSVVIDKLWASITGKTGVRPGADNDPLLGELPLGDFAAPRAG
jgi:hypothetical protein